MAQRCTACKCAQRHSSCQPQIAPNMGSQAREARALSHCKRALHTSADTCGSPAPAGGSLSASAGALAAAGLAAASAASMRTRA